MTVKATREGLIGKRTASGWIIDTERSFVALPSHKALHRWVILTNPVTLQTTRAEVLDVGPWNIDDHDYVFGSARPQAESGVDRFGRHTNGAGIDLGQAVWRDLGMTDNGEVSWVMEALPGEAS